MRTIAFLLLLLVAGAGVCAAGYQINWYSINSGGGLVTGGGYKLNSTIGQPAAGFVKNTSYLHWVGFWAGEVPAPAMASKVSDAKLWPDGTFVSIAAKIATSDAGDFAGCFYIEEETRASGIRVSTPGGPIATLARGNKVNVIGTLGTTPAGERELTGPIVVIVSSRDPLLPLGMTNKAIGGGDYGDPGIGLGQYGVANGFGTSNIGLLIQTWGKVTAKNTGYVEINDGSGTPVRVDTSTLADPPDMDEYVTVIGLSSLYTGRLRLILPRDDTDMGRP